MSRIPRTRITATVDRVLTEAQDLGLIMNRADSGNGDQVLIDGRSYRNFGSCSYMGLETDPRLIAGARTALEDYGTQFSFSRAYLESPLYAQLEDLLDTMTGRSVLVAPSTTLAHLAALPVLVGDADAVIIDQFAHASLQMAVDLLKGTTVEKLRHNRMDLLEERITALAATAEKVWFVGDGIYSMLGDLADLDALDGLLHRHPQLHAYIDDAHAVSWTGTAGRGVALERLGHHDRVVVALSLNKAFSAGGGAVALPSDELRSRIRRCGGPMLFSGPIPPPMLGAAVASAQLHLDPAFPAMQAELHERILVADAAIASYGLRVATHDRTPIFMVQFESPRSLHHALNGMRDRGFYCCLSTFPAVPLNKPSLRFTVSRHNAAPDIAHFVAELADVVGARSTQDHAAARIA